jgi:altronate dehydratase
VFHIETMNIGLLINLFDMIESVSLHPNFFCFVLVCGGGDEQNLFRGDYGLKSFRGSQHKTIGSQCSTIRG